MKIVGVNIVTPTGTRIAAYPPINETWSGLTADLFSLTFLLAPMLMAGKVGRGYGGPVVRLIASLGFFCHPWSDALHGVKSFAVPLLGTAMTDGRLACRHLPQTAEQLFRILGIASGKMPINILSCHLNLPSDNRFGGEEPRVVIPESRGVVLAPHFSPGG